MSKISHFSEARNLPGQTSDPDITLIHAVASGDEAALNELYTRHGAYLLDYLTSILHDRQQAEEVLQDVMLAAWEHAGEFRGDSKVRTWLFAIARHQAINAVRRTTPQMIPFNDNERVLSNDTTPLEKIERKMQRQALVAAIQQLPPCEKKVLKLVFYDRLSCPEIAHVLGIPLGTVKSRLHRAKAILRRVLQSPEDKCSA